MTNATTNANATTTNAKEKKAMAARKNRQARIDAHRQTRTEIGTLLEWLGQEIERREDANAGWGEVNALGTVRQNLIQTLAFMAGLEEDEIRQALDDMKA